MTQLTIVTTAATMFRTLNILRLRPALQRPLRSFSSANSHRTFARFSPWSDNFAGTQRTRTFLQSISYAILIVGATELVDSYLLVRVKRVFLFMNLLQKDYSRSNGSSMTNPSMHLLANCHKPSRSCAIHFLYRMLS